MSGRTLFDARKMRLNPIKPSPAKLTRDGMVDGSELLRNKTKQDEDAFADAQKEFDRVAGTPGAWGGA